MLCELAATETSRAQTAAVALELSEVYFARLASRSSFDLSFASHSFLTFGFAPFIYSLCWLVNSVSGTLDLFSKTDFTHC